jgi:hypothetical protein
LERYQLLAEHTNDIVLQRGCCGMALGFYVARSLANALNLMAAAANGIAEGDLLGNFC